MRIVARSYVGDTYSSQQASGSSNIIMGKRQATLVNEHTHWTHIYIYEGYDGLSPFKCLDGVHCDMDG